jgi:predicted phosphodiesterase
MGPRARPKITNAIFETPIKSHLDEYKPKQMNERQPLESMAVISDIHWPFVCQRVVDRYLEWVGKHKPKFAIIDGDAWDMYSHGKFPRSHNLFTPKEEEELARKMNEDFWKAVQKASPKTKCYQLLGNHDVRPLKRVLEQVPTMAHWIDGYFKTLFTFDGVETIFDPRQELIIGDVMIHHGYRSGLGDHRDFSGFNCIVGHTHKPGIVYKSMGVGHHPKWEANCGLAGDPMAKGLSYTPQKTTGWTNSFLAVDSDGPRVIIC